VSIESKARSAFKRSARSLLEVGAFIGFCFVLYCVIKVCESLEGKV